LCHEKEGRSQSGKKKYEKKLMPMGEIAKDDLHCPFTPLPLPLV
jgi:hypothetical protein